MKSSQFLQNKAQVGGAYRIVGTDPSQVQISYSGNIASIYGDNNSTGCIYGETLTPTGICEICPSGKYSVSLNSDQCKPCPNNCECPGVDVINMNPGFWRTSIYSDDIVECYNQRENCLGGSENFTCAIGHVGARCQSCDIEGVYWGEKWSHASALSCGKCLETENNTLKIVVINIMVFVNMLIAVKGTIKLVQDKIMIKILKLIFRGFRTEGDKTGILIKMLTNYFQIIAIVSTFRIDMPQSFVDVNENVGNPVKTMGYSLDCFLVDFQKTVPHFYFRIIWIILMNVSQLIGFMIIFAGINQTLERKFSFGSIVWTAIIYDFVTLQPNYLNATLEAFSCLNIGGQDYILGNLELKCGTEQYNKWTYSFVLPLLALWAIVFPLMIFLAINRASRRGQLDKSAVLFKFGFMYQEYARDDYYWEFVKMFEKMVIVIVTNIYSEDIKTKAVLVFLSLFFYGILSYFIKPYEEAQLNQLDLAQTAVCCLSVVLGLFLYNIQYDEWLYIGFFVMGLINVMFILYMIKLLLHGITGQLLKNDDLMNSLTKVPVVSGIVLKSQDKIKKRKQHWKFLQKIVFVVIDGIQAGIIISNKQPINIDFLNQIIEDNIQDCDSCKSQLKYDILTWQQIQENVHIINSQQNKNSDRALTQQNETDKIIQKPQEENQTTLRHQEIKLTPNDNQQTLNNQINDQNLNIIEDKQSEEEEIIFNDELNEKNRDKSKTQKKNEQLRQLSIKNAIDNQCKKCGELLPLQLFILMCKNCQKCQDLLCVLCFSQKFFDKKYQKPIKIEDEEQQLDLVKKNKQKINVYQVPTDNNLTLATKQEIEEDEEKQLLIQENQYNYEQEYKNLQRKVFKNHQKPNMSMIIKGLVPMHVIDQMKEQLHYVYLKRVDSERKQKARLIEKIIERLKKMQVSYKQKMDFVYDEQYKHKNIQIDNDTLIAKIYNNELEENFFIKSVLPSQIKNLKKDNKDCLKLLFMKPEIKNTAKYQFSFIFNNINENKKLGIGIAYQTKLINQQYEIDNIEINHGIYMILADGTMYSGHESQINAKKIKTFSIDKGDTVEFLIDPDAEFISYHNVTKKLHCKQALKYCDDDCYLYICCALQNQDDEVQMINALEVVFDKKIEKKFQKKNKMDFGHSFFQSINNKTNEKE